MNMMTAVMHPDAFPVEKVQLGGWGGELGHTAVSSGQSHRPRCLAWELKRTEPASRLVSGSTDFFDVTIKQMLDTFKLEGSSDSFC